MIEALFSNLYGVIGALLLACFGAYLVWRNGHKTRLANASGAFRAAFATELSTLQSGNKIDVHGLLLSGFTKHSEAVVVFRPFVFCLQRSRFGHATAKKSNSKPLARRRLFQSDGTRLAKS